MKEWIVADVDKTLCLKLSEELKISPILSVLLNVRGLKDKNNIMGFLYGYNDFLNPYDFIDMDKLVCRLKKAIDNFKKICIYGDYDADGITATTMMYLYLKSLDANVMYYVPKRDEEGYGLNIDVINYLKECSVDVIFTVDNGISAEKEVEYANKLGIEVIITDHHRPPEKIPNGTAVVDPYREDCRSRFKNFSGVGVAFKVIAALETGKKSIDELMDLYGDLVTIGTIGDSIELNYETRDFVRKGLSVIETTNRPAIKVLIDKCSLTGKKLDAVDIAFNIVPKINACGRMGSAYTPIRFLLCEDTDEAEKMYNEINNQNNLRKSIEIQIMDSIEKKLKSQPEILLDKVIICEGEDWHTGVLGIVASRITEKYGKPSIIISYGNEDATGSARSIEGFSIHDAISECSHCLERFGGHPMAAGVNLKTSNISKFKQCLLNYAESFGEMPTAKLFIDFKINPLSISEDILNELEKLKPFGNSNSEPIFGLYNMKIDSITEVGGGKHLRIVVSRENKKITVMYFGKSKKDFLYTINDNVDLAVTVHKNTYAGYDMISLFLKDIKLAGIDTHKCIIEKRIYEKFKRNENLSENEIEIIYPSREEFALVYRYVKKNYKKVYVPEFIVYDIKSDLLNVAKVMVIFDVMNELKIANVSFKGDEYYITLNNMCKKVDLMTSEILNNINKDK